MGLKDLIEYKDLFFYFFVPGFIFFRVLTLFLPIKTYEISKSVLEIITYGAINYIFYLFLNESLQIEDNLFFKVAFFALIPIVLALVISCLLRNNHFRKLYDIAPRPWDKKFLNEEDVYVIIILKDDSAVGGYFGKNSSVSWYPQEREIYIEEEWFVDREDERLSYKALDSDGIWVNCSDIKSLKFYKNIRT